MVYDKPEYMSTLQISNVCLLHMDAQCSCMLRYISTTCVITLAPACVCEGNSFGSVLMRNIKNHFSDSFESNGGFGISCGHTLRYHVRNDDIREKLKVENITERCRKARLGWFDHVKRRDHDYVGRKTLEMVPPGRRETRKTEAEMDGLCQPRHESHRNDERRSP